MVNLQVMLLYFQNGSEIDLQMFSDKKIDNAEKEGTDDDVTEAI